MTTLTTEQTVLNKAQGTVSGLQHYIEQPVANSMNYPKLAGTVIASYVVLEVINHAILGAYVMPYLTTSLGLSMGVASALTYGLVAVSALALSWVAYKFFFQKKPKVIKNVKYVPVESTQVQGVGQPV